MDTDTTTTDLVIIDAEIVEDDDSFGKEIAKTVGVTAATSVAVIVTVLAFNFLKPRVASLFSRSKKTETEEVVETIDTPETAQV